MSKFSNTIEYNLRTTLDSSGINKLKGELSAVMMQLDRLGKRSLLDDSKVKEAQGQINKVSEALSKAMNPSTGLININSFKKELDGLSLSSLEKSMKLAGTEGSKAFGNIITQVGKMDTSTRSISNFADKIFNTMGNTARWGVTAGIFQRVTNTLSQSVEYVKDLDTSLNNIRIVTGASNDNMRDFARTANTAAQSLGSSTVSFTDAAQLFAQNGFNEADYTRLAEITQKVANVTQQDTATVSEQVTSLMEGYHMSIDEVENALSGMSVVAAASASDLEELATAEQKVASTASTLGVSQEQLTAQIGTIVSVTRQAPESVGNALKTLYARIADLKMGDTLEDGVDLGTVSGKLADIGVQVLDETGNLRNLGDVLTDLQKKWTSLSDAQQISIATTVAGKYQLNAFTALMENADMYQSQYEMMTSSAGALDEQQAIYMDSMQARLQSLQTAGEGVINSLFDPNDFKPFISGLTDVLKLVQQFVDALGGADHILNGLGATAMKLFSNQIGQTFTNTLTNFQKRQSQTQSAKEVITKLGAVGEDSDHVESLNFVNNMLDKQESMSLDQRKEYNAALQDTVNMENKVLDLKKQQISAEEKLRDFLNHQTSPESLDVRNAVEVDEKGHAKSTEEIESYDQKLQDRQKTLSTAAEAIRSRLSDYQKKSRLTKKEQKRLSENNGQQFNINEDIRRIISDKDKGGSFNNFIEAFKSAGGDVDAFKEKLTNLGSVKTFDELQKKIANIKTLLEEVNVQADKTKSEHVQASSVIDNLNATAQALGEAEASLEGQGKTNGGIVDKIDLQSSIATISTLAGSVGQLFFAWQSFQSLGSLLTNDDLSAGEKFAQTLELMVFTLPSILDGLGGMHTALVNLGIAEEFAEGASALKNLKTSLSNAGTAFTSLKDAAVAVFEAIVTGAKSVGAALAAAIKPMLPLLAITAAVGLATAAFSAAAQAEQDRIDGIKDSADAAAQSLTSVQDAQSSFESVYEKYKQGEASSSDLAEAAKTLNGLIDDQSAKAQAAAGNWDAYAKSVSNAAASNAAANANSIQQGVWQAEKEYVSAPGLFQSRNQKYDSNFDNDTLNNAYSNAGSITSGGANGNRFFAFAAGTTAEQRIQDLDNMTQAYKDAIEQAQNNLNSIADVSSDEYKQAQDTLSQLQADYGNFSSFRSQYSEQESELKENWNNQAQNLLAQYQGDSDLQYSGGTVDEYKAQVKQQLAQKTGSNVADQVVDAFVEGMESAGTRSGEALASEIGKESAEEIYNSLNSDQQAAIDNGGLTEEQRISLLGQLDTTATVESINNQIREIQQNGSLDSVTINSDYSSNLETANNTESSLGNLFDKYESNGGFSDSEVADILQENPEYMVYLTKIGDQWKLNQQALNDYNDSLKEQSAAVDDAMGGTSSFENYNDLLERMTHFESHPDDTGTGNFNDSAMDAFSSANQDLNTSLANGEIGFTDYFNGISDALNNSGALESLDNLNGKFDETTDALEETASVAATELSDGLLQANKAFVKGDTSVSDYIDQLDAGLDAQKELLDSTYNLEDGTDGYVEASEDADDATKAAAKAYNDATDAQKGLEQASGFADAIQNNADLLSDYGQTLDDVFSDESIMSDSRLPQYVSDLTNQFINFAGSSSENMQTAIQQISSATGQSQQYIGQLLTQATSSDQAQAASAAATLQSLTGGSMASIQQLTGAAMSNVATGISNASQAIGSVLSSLGTAISGFNYNIEATPYITGGFSLRTDEKGIPNGINLPTWGYDIAGKGGGSVADFASALQSAGDYFTNAGNQQAANEALDISSYYPSGSSAGATPSSGRTGGSGGSGGSGDGSGSNYTPKSKDTVEDAVDRYERVNAELDTLDKNLDKISDNQDRVVGFQIADNMEQQISLIKQQIEWTKKKMEIQKDEAAEYRNELASTYGIMYDAEGHITNYADVYKNLLNNLNGLINQYNADTTEAGQDALEKQIDTAQKSFDNFSDLVSKYDDLVSDSILESEKDIQDYYDKIEDLQIEAFQKAVDAVDNIKDLQDKIIDFNAVFSGLDSDSPFRKMFTSLDKLKTYWDVNTKSVDAYYDELISRNNKAMAGASAQQKKSLEYQNKVLEAARQQYGKGTFEAGGTGLFDMTMANLNTILEQMRQFEETGTSTIFGEDSGDMYEVGNDIFDNATSLLEDYEDQLDDLHDSILDAIDDIADRIDDRMDAYENIGDELEHYADIIEMVHGENSYDELNQVSQATVNNNQAAINELKQNIAMWQDMLGSLKEGSEEWKKVNEKIQDAQSDLLDKTSDTIQEMVDMYERGVNKILDKWVGSTGMGDDLDWISEQWELINRNADYYLDDVNSAYQIQKLQGKYLDLLDDSNGLDIQNQITQQMQQQLSYLREKDKLSEYDVNYANAQLEILQKTIALQEAERNKSQLKLKRDTQGNYSYVYSADENNVRSAQSDLLDAQNNAYNLSKDQMKQTQDDSLSALQDARNTIQQIWTNANLTLEEKTARTQTIIDSLKEYLAGTSEQLSESEKNIINDFVGMCEILTDENSDKLQDVYNQIVSGNTDAFDQIDTRWQTSITNWLKNMDKFNTSTDQAFKDLTNNFQGYQTKLDELGTLAGMTFNDLSGTIDNATKKTDSLASSTAAFIDQLKNDSATVKDYEDALTKMTAKIQDAENGMRAYQEQVNQLQQNLTAKEQENANLSSQVKDLQSKIDTITGANSGGGGGGGSANSETAWGIAKAIWTYGGASGWGNDPIRSGKLIKAYGSDFAKEVQSIINQNYRSNKLVDYGSMKYSSYNLIGYRSGGYTGDDWSASEKQAGKIGLLHEKELILNKTDTENILNAVDMVRSMVAVGRNGNYNDIIRQSNNVVDMSSITKPLDDMGQTYYQVECTFPNATNVDEIQRAILTLPDIAPQYAYKS